MKKSYRYWFLALVMMAIGVTNLRRQQFARAQTAGAAVARAKPAEMQVPGAPIPTRVLVESPVETVTELQTICLFASAPENALHGSLLEMNEKLKGLLEQIRKPTLFRGELGETIVVAAPPGSLGARRLLIVGLGDSRVFAPQNMDFIGAIVYRESTRMGIAHPYFAPTVLDGGVTKFTTGEIAENFVGGFLRAARTEKILKSADASGSPVVQDLTFLAGPSHAADTQQGIERAFAASSQSAKNSMRKIYEEDQKNRSDVDAMRAVKRTYDNATLDRYWQSMNQPQILSAQFGHSDADPVSPSHSQAKFGSCMPRTKCAVSPFACAGAFLPNKRLSGL